MYADRVEALEYRSIKERLNGDSAAGSSRRRPTSGKRRREDDDKWEHDLFESDMPQVSKFRFGVKDLRLKLQKKNIEQATKSARGTALGGARDLREKLSGKLDSRSINSQPFRPKPAPEARKPPRNTPIAAITEVPTRETMKIAGSASKNRTQQKVETADSFLQSLGLEKYSITFQAEEVDMTALVHMGEEDLKAMGIPMGPRKKILLALESKA